MQKKFIQNLSLLLLLNLLIKPFWILGIDREVQKIVGTSEYGLYFALFNLSFLLNILLDFGITNFNNRNIAQNNHLINKHFSSIFGLKLLLGIFYLLTTLLLGLVVGYRGWQIELLMVMGFNQFLAFFLMYLRSNLAGLHLFKTDAVISVLDRSLMIIFCSMLIWGNWSQAPFQIEWYVYAQTLAYLITVFITSLIVMKKARFKKIKWNKPFFLLIMRKSFPYAILVLLMTFYCRFDTVMLERMLPAGVGAEQSGIYAAAFRLLDAANMISFLFAGMLLPLFARMIKFKESVEQLVKLSFLILAVPAFIVAVGCSFFAQDIMALLYNDHIEESAQVFRIIMWCFMATSLSYIFGTLLTANGNLKLLNRMALVGMCINLGANLLLIPVFYAPGAAVSSLCTQFITAGVQIFLAYRIFRFHWNVQLIKRLLIFVPAVLFFAFVFSNFSLHMAGSLSWLVQMLLFAGASGAFALAIGLINLKSLYKVIKFG